MILAALIVRISAAIFYIKRGNSERTYAKLLRT
jgi:hypothetical protein